jgi:hypothetical protein
VAESIPRLVAFGTQAVFLLLHVMDTRLRPRGGESLRELKGRLIGKAQLPTTVGISKRTLIRRTVQAGATPQAMRPIGVDGPHPVEAGLITGRLEHRADRVFDYRVDVTGGRSQQRIPP